MSTSPKRDRVARLPLTIALRWSIGLSILATALLIAVLSVRMVAGQDPALGLKLARDQASTAAPTQTVTVPAPAALAPVIPAPVAAPAPAPVQTTTS